MAHEPPFGRLEVKICGITDAAGFDAACEVDADWIGLNFFPASPRALTPAAAAALSRRVQGGPGRVGLFVEPTDADIAATLAEIRLDALQVYTGAERASAIAARFGLPVWRAVGVSAPEELPARGAAEARLLVEPKPPLGATRPGGNAVTLDWTITAGWRAPRPWMLAGGLTPDNVASAVLTSGAAGVDVSSGVEQARGVKSPALIRAFTAVARQSPTLGRAGPDEAEAVALAHVAAFHEAYAGLLPPQVLARKTVAGMTPLWARTLDAGDPVFVVREGGAIVGLGSAGARRNGDPRYAADVRALYVRRDSHRRGYGRALMAAMARDLAARGLRGCSLEVLAGNVGAIGFYEAMGGRALGDAVDADGVAHVTYGWDDVSAWLWRLMRAETGG